jgi:hypothetical protein
VEPDAVGPEINDSRAKSWPTGDSSGRRAIWHGTCKEVVVTIDSSLGSAVTTPARDPRARIRRLPRSNAPQPEIISERHQYPFPWRAAVGLTLSALSVPTLFMIFLYCCERFGDK